MNNDDDKTNLPAKQPPPRQKTRLPRAHGNEKRSRGDCAPPREGSQTFDSASLLETGETPTETAPEKTDNTFPKAHRLRKPAEFQRVYKTGKRLDARFVSAFVLPNNLEHHRLGITASRKAVGNAVQRNRAKRLLREAFRLSKTELGQLGVKYDFVLNARRNLLKVKMREPLEDFQRLVKQIVKSEIAAKISANNETAANVNLTTEPN